MTFRYQPSQPIVYRVIPPKWKIIEPQDSLSTSPSRYIESFDQSIESEARSNADDAPIAEHNLVSFVFGSRLKTHDTASRSLAQLILDRRRLTKKHMEDIQWRMDDLMQKKPMIPVEIGKLSEVEKLIMDLERQKRQIQLNEWRDLLDLRKSLVEERQGYGGVRARMHYLTGGSGGSGGSGESGGYGGVR